MTSPRKSRLRTKLTELPPLEEEEVEFFRWLWDSYNALNADLSKGFYVVSVLRWLRLKQLCRGFASLCWPNLVISNRYNTYYEFINNSPVKHVVRLRALELAAMFEKEKDVINL